MDRLFSRCTVQQCSQMRHGVRVREKHRSRCYLVSPFHSLFLLPTEFLRVSSAWHRTSTGPSHIRGGAEVSEPLGTQRWWHFDLYSVWGKAKFVSPMYNIPQCRHFVMGSYTYASSLMKPAAFSSTAQGRRKHFRIGQPIKNFLLALLASFPNTITTCKASLRLVDASGGLKLMGHPSNS